MAAPAATIPGSSPSMSPLAEQMQLVYFDHRGQGRSGLADPDADPARFTLDENVADMEALRVHLGLGPVVSIGTSYGGMVAMAHAARYPQRGLAPDPDRHRRAWRLHSARPGDRRASAARRSSSAFAKHCGPARSARPSELRHYYEVMGPLYARHHDPAAAAAGRARAIHAPEPINRAFGPTASCGGSTSARSCRASRRRH